jgi:hypothetical protein
VGTNGTVIKSKDGKELSVDTSSLSCDMIMDMFRNPPKGGNYFDSLCLMHYRIFQDIFEFTFQDKK